MNIAIIVDTREQLIEKAVEKHQPYLEGWHINAIVDKPIKHPNDYNKLLTSDLFWSSLQHYNKVLIFQHDSGLLRNGVEEFLEWDYVGAPWFESAPWARKDRAGGNGGLSLRCPKKALNLIREFPYRASYGNEDVYFTHYLEKVNGKVAPYEVCKKFSVETEFALGTLGYHAINKHLPESECIQIFSQYGNKSLLREQASNY